MTVSSLRRTAAEKPAIALWLALTVVAAFVVAAFAASCGTVASAAASANIAPGASVAVLSPSVPFAPALGAWLVLCAVIESAGLYVLVWLGTALGGSARATGIATALVFSAMSTVAFGARGSESVDPYTYMQYARAPSFAAAYAPVPNEALPAAFRAAGTYAGPQPVPCVYGPLWLGAMRFLLANVRTPDAAFVLLRLAGIVAFGLFLTLLAASGVDGITLLALALCAPLYEFFVVEVHNDLWALLILAAAGALLRTPLRGIACVVAAAAALVKLNFALIALVVLARPMTRRRRALEVLAVAAIALGGSELLTGPAYFTAIRLVAAYRAPGISNVKLLTFEALRILLAAVAAGSILMAYGRDRWWRGAAWALPALASSLWPWYAAWGLPFALRMRGVRTAFVVSLPLLALVLDRAVTMGLKAGLVSVYFAGMLVWALADAARPSAFTSERAT